MTVSIGVRQGIIPNVAVKVQRLRISEISIWHRSGRSRPIRAGEPALRRREIPCPEVIEAGLTISFFARKLQVFSIRRSWIDPAPSIAARAAISAGGDLLAERQIVVAAERGKNGGKNGSA